MKLTRIFFFLLLSIGFYVNAQESAYYKVKEGETLKDVANLFDLSYLDVINANPDVSRWPKAGESIKLPGVSPDNPKLVKLNTELPVELPHPIDAIPDNKEDLKINTSGNKVHVVQPRETLYGLSRLYGVTVVAIKEANPILKTEGLRIYQNVIIPEPEEDAIPVDPKSLSTRSHIVKSKETLYGISKKYKINIVDIKKANPILETEGLKVGQVIEIPDVEEVVVAKPTQNRDGYLHLVQPKETLYGISRQYGLTILELLDANEEVSNGGLKVGMEILIPKQKKNKFFSFSKKEKEQPKPKKKKKIQEIENDFVIHKVVHGETKESISELYGMNSDSLVKLNPIIDVYGVLSGMRLKIKQKDSIATIRKALNVETFEDSLVVDVPLKLMFLLPLELEKNDTLEKEILFSNKNSLPSIVADFYMGSLLAIDSLKMQGVDVEYTTIDTYNSTDSLAKRLIEIDDYNPDAFIGPLFNTNAQFIAEKFKHIPVFYPFYSKKQVGLMETNIVKTTTNKEVFKEKILEYIKKNRTNQRLILAGDANKKEALKSIAQTLDKLDSIGNRENKVLVTTPSNGYLSREDFITTLDSLETNYWVLIASHNNIIADNVVNHVRSLVDSTNVRLFAYEKNTLLDKLPLYTQAKFQFTYGSEMNEEIELDKTHRQFYETYNQKFKTYPGKYALRGFDLIYDSTLRLLKSKALKTGLMMGYSSRVNSKFDYQLKEDKYIQNQVVQLYQVDSLLNTKKIVEVVDVAPEVESLEEEIFEPGL